MVKEELRQEDYLSISPELLRGFDKLHAGFSNPLHRVALEQYNNTPPGR
jgi:hypothetical protein